MTTFIVALSLISPVQDTTKKPAPYTESLPNSVVKINMVPIPGSKTVKPFFMATTETCWEAFDVFLQSGPPSKPYEQAVFKPDAVARPSRSYHLPDRGFGHRGFPVISVSYTNCEMFCRWLSSVTKKKYRLPTEAEFVHAATAGAKAPWKMTEAEIDKVSWNYANIEEVTSAVAKKAPNAFGLYDTLGNVGEWSTDAKGEPVLCGPTFMQNPEEVSPTFKQKWIPAWQESDPQIPKSRWWLSDGPFCGFRIVCEG